MYELDKCLKLLSSGFSIITVGKLKKPNFSWKSEQSKALSTEEFAKRYNYKGGITTKGGYEIPATENIGIVTGYCDLEVVDVDLKHLPTAKDRKYFWDELLSLLNDNIFDFFNKFSIAKTQNEGFHILYKSRKLEGNQKLAKLEGMKEAVLETRGIGGYVFVYDNFLTDRGYHDISYISDEDREILITACRGYDFMPVDEREANKEKKQSNVDGFEYGKSTWDDYNDKTDILDIVGDELKVVRNLTNRFEVKRFGSKAAHSGYVYKNSGCMYLFSSNTSYPAEELITPFRAYAIKNHNGDMSAAAKDLYRQGYGDRIKPVLSAKRETEPCVEDDARPEDVSFPYWIFPPMVGDYIKACSDTLHASIDFMGCAFLWSCSLVIGNSMKIRVKNNWEEAANVWFAMVGKKGVGKTPSINHIVKPLRLMNMNEIRKYDKEFAKYEDYLGLDKKEKQLVNEVFKPKRAQFITTDFTVESLNELHSESLNGVGIIKDELRGWINDMNKYRKGSDLEYWLSCWSGQEAISTRKTSKSTYNRELFVPIIGGIQPGILEHLATDENEENGLVDRFLFCYPDFDGGYYCEDEIDPKLMDWYNKFMESFYTDIKKLIRYKNGDIDALRAGFSKEAKGEWVRIYNKIVSVMKSDDEDEYIKSILPKAISYVPRFSLILNTVNEYAKGSNDYASIKKQSVLDAESLIDYFVSMARKVKDFRDSSKDINFAVSNNKGKSKFEIFMDVYNKDKKVNRARLAEKLGVSRQTIQRYINEADKNENR